MNEEISVRKRLRQVCEFFEQLNSPLLIEQANEADNADKAGGENYLPTEAVITIREWLSANGIENADLIAIRHTPHKWCRGEPYLWLWILHRYTNRYAKS